MDNKIFNNQKKTNRKIVLVGGCFDFIHFGHISFLKQAKAAGDYLIVALEADENVKRRKGRERPIHNQKQRKEMLGALSFIDEIILLPPMTKNEEYYDLVKKIKPHIIAVTAGDTYLAQKKDQADIIGAKLIEIPKVETPSTSQLAKLIGLE